jgi:hypothetical protein
LPVFFSVFIFFFVFYFFPVLNLFLWVVFEHCPGLAPPVPGRGK